MMYDALDQHRARMSFRDRGRPQTASPQLRENGYKDDDGRYVITGGLKPWHERIVDWMLLNPNAKVVDVAREFAVTPQWAGMLMRTDAFREYYSMRMRDHQEKVSDEIISKAQGVAVRALDLMDEAMEKRVATFDQTRDAAELALKALGYTSQKVNVNVDQRRTQNNVVMVPAEKLAQARQNMRQVSEQKEVKQDVEANYRYVTASLDLGIEDAVVVPDGDGE